VRNAHCPGTFPSHYSVNKKKWSPGLRTITWHYIIIPSNERTEPFSRIAEGPTALRQIIQLFTVFTITVMNTKFTDKQTCGEEWNKQTDTVAAAKSWKGTLGYILYSRHTFMDDGGAEHGAHEPGPQRWRMGQIFLLCSDPLRKICCSTPIRRSLTTAPLRSAPQHLPIHSAPIREALRKSTAPERTF
jgi:hypothetical protein